MKRVLIAFDGSEGAIAAILDLIHAGLPRQLEAKVVTIADVWLPGTSPAAAPKASGAETGAPAHAKAQEALREAKKVSVNGAQLLHEHLPLWNITNDAVADSPAWGIIAEARRWDANLVVVGSHGRSPLERFFIGSVSYKIAAEASCSVRVVKEHSSAGRQQHIMIAVDGSDDSIRALHAAMAREWRFGTEIHIVTVIDPKMKSTVLGSAERYGGVERAEDWIEARFQAIREEFSDRTLKMHFRILEGDPKSRLLGYAADHTIDTVFLGARGLNHGDRLYLGTLASAVCTRVHCTVEIVRPPGSQLGA